MKKHLAVGIAAALTTAGLLQAPAQADPSPSSAAGAGWLAELSGDRAAMGDIGQRTRQTAERKFDVDKVAEQFEQILDASASSRALTAS